MVSSKTGYQLYAWYLLFCARLLISSTNYTPMRAAVCADLLGLCLLKGVFWSVLQKTSTVEKGWNTRQN